MKTLFLSLLVITFVTLMGHPASAQPKFMPLEGYTIRGGAQFTTAPNGDIYAVANNGLFRSQDNGKSWSWRIVEDYGSGNSIYIGENGTIFYLSSYNWSALYRSTDNGETFDSTRNTMLSQQQLQYTDGNTIRLSNGYVSNDGGKNWTFSVYYYQYVTKGSHHYAFDGTWHRSTDRGNNWHAWSGEPGKMIFGMGSKIYMLDSNRVMNSTNDGVTWRSNPLPFRYNTSNRAAADSIGNLYLHDYRYDPNTGATISSSYYRTSDDGLNWDSTKTKSTLAPAAVISDGRLLMRDVNLFVANGKNFEPWMALTLGVSSLSDDGNGRLWITTRTGETSTGSPAYTQDNGRNWKPSETPSKGVPTNILAVKDIVIQATKKAYGNYLVSELTRSTDRGASWQVVREFGKDTTVARFAADGDWLFAATSNAGVLRSTDDGLTWAESNNGMTNGVCYDLVNDNNGRLLLGTANGLFISRDRGLTWQRRDVIFWEPAVLSIAVDRNGRIYTGTGLGVYRSENETNWERVFTGLSDDMISVLSIDSAQNLYAGTRSHYITSSPDDHFLLHFSSNAGASWREINDSMFRGDTNTTLLGVWTDRAGYVYISNGLGLFRTETPVKDVASIRQINSKQVQFLEYSNGNFIIHGELTNVRIEIYDRAGRLIASASGDTQAIESELTCSRASDAGWLAYVLTSNDKVERGTLLTSY
jgi:photosystem II stability/assembly factor-like uncharacterized protein